MAPKMTMAITLALFIVFTTANAVTPFCKFAKDEALCSKMTKDAPTWAKAMFNAITYELALVKSGQSVVNGVASKLPDDLEPSDKQDVIDTCNEVYKNMNENLKMAFGFIKKDPYPMALQAAIEKSYFDGCVARFEFVTEISAPPDLTKFSGEIDNTIDTLDALRLTRPQA